MTRHGSNDRIFRLEVMLEIIDKEDCSGKEWRGDRRVDREKEILRRNNKKKRMERKTIMKRKDLEELANKYDECRVFIEFADAHPKLFAKWVLKQTGMEGKDLE